MKSSGQLQDLNFVDYLAQIGWPDTVSNSGLRARTHQLNTGDDIRRRRWGWIDHTLWKQTNINYLQTRPNMEPTRKKKKRTVQGTREKGSPDRR